MLHLVGCTIFTNKSATLVCVHTWAAVALIHMYEQLEDGTYAKTRQLAGYMTLLQGWIYEHFPSIVFWVGTPLYDVWGWESHFSCNCTIAARYNQITWHSVFSYKEHREERPFECISLFSGYIKLGDNFTCLNVFFVSMDMCRGSLGYASTLRNNHLSLSRAQPKLFSFSGASKQNAMEKVNFVDVIPITSSNDILYLLFL